MRHIEICWLAVVRGVDTKCIRICVNIGAKADGPFKLNRIVTVRHSNKKGRKLWARVHNRKISSLI